LKYFGLLIILSLFGCTTNVKNKLIGLWQLENVWRDKLAMDHQTTFIKIDKNGSFALSRTSGGLSGTYTYSSKKINLTSEDKDWFNTSWAYIFSKDQVFLQGKDRLGRNLKLEFNKIYQIPDFQEFENKVIGQWKLYKIRNRGHIEKPLNTLFEINENSKYVITKGDTILEKGNAIINTRHKKIIFESGDMIWDAWFYGEELRINNTKLKIEYSLRKLSS
jgi:hypothetical protein